jgi:hypothetical protein
MYSHLITFLNLIPTGFDKIDALRSSFLLMFILAMDEKEDRDNSS